MAKVKVYNMGGEEVETLDVNDEWLNLSVNPQVIKNYLVAIRNNRRQFSANTKGRSEIAHSNAKPRPQKGTGRARQGTINAPQYRGGGVVFGPKPKFDQSVRINQTERRLAIRFLLAEKIKEGSMHIFRFEGMEKPKTKQVTPLLKGLGVVGKRVLFLGQKEKESGRLNFYLSMRNVPKTSFAPVGSLSGYDVIKAQDLVVFESAFDQLIGKLRKD